MRILPSGGGFLRPRAPRLPLHRTAGEADEQRLVRYVGEKRHSDALYLLLSQHKRQQQQQPSSSPLRSSGDTTGATAKAAAAASSSAGAAEILVRRADQLVDAESFLHYALQNQPTADLVEYVLNLAGGNVGCGSNGGTLLHAAAAHGCSRGVVEAILHDVTGTDQARSLDEFGRCPLHWACVNPRKAKKHVCRGVVEVLLSAYPEAQDLPDKGGNTPLDLAKTHGAGGGVVRLLNGGGPDDESSTSSSASSFFRRASFSSSISKRGALASAAARRPSSSRSLSRTLTPHTLPDDGASDEGTHNDDDDRDACSGPPQDYRQLYQVMATKAQDEDDDDVSSLGCED